MIHPFYQGFNRLKPNFVSHWTPAATDFQLAVALLKNKGGVVGFTGDQTFCAVVCLFS